MIQRISVRVKVISGDRVLLLRRADGRESILGKYELPGGRVLDGEQPEDAASRYLSEDLGFNDSTHFQLEDAITFTDSDDRTIQYAVIIYRTAISAKKRAIKPSSHYDKYVWYSHGKIEEDLITDVSKLAMGSLFLSSNVTETKPGASSQSPDAPVIIYTDGGSRGNPGPSAAGYVAIRNGDIIDQGGEYLGITTNNQAEYQAAVMGLEAGVKLGLDVVELRLDSLLVANQLNGVYKVKNRELWPINDRARELLRHFKRAKIIHIPREMNQLADGIVNRILDRQLDVI